MTLTFSSSTWSQIRNIGFLDWTLVSSSYLYGNGSTTGSVYLNDTARYDLAVNRWQLFQTTNNSYTLRTQACGASGFLVGPASGITTSMGPDVLDGSANWYINFNQGDPGYTFTNLANGSTRYLYAYGAATIALSSNLNTSNDAFYWGIASGTVAISEAAFDTVSTNVCRRSYKVSYADLCHFAGANTDLYTVCLGFSHRWSVFSERDHHQHAFQ